MKLTEAKLKQMIKEMMTTGRLIHNGKPSLSENGKKLEDMILTGKSELIDQAESLLDALSSALDPLEADYLDALIKAASGNAKLKRLVNDERNRLNIPRATRPPRNTEYGHGYNAARKEFLEAFDRLERILGREEADKLQRSFQDVVI